MLPEDVRRFVALEDEGRKRLRAGNLDGAAEAFRAQIAIFDPNSEPHVALAVLEASRGRKEAAIEHLTNAVARGFTELGRIERAEAWRGLKNDLDFTFLQGTIPKLLETERKWGGWGAFKTLQPPVDLAEAVQAYERRMFLIEGASPAFGTRLTRLWRRLTERGAAALIETYIAERPDAHDLYPALEKLVSLYSGGPGFRWEVLQPDIARRLGKIGAAVLEKYPESRLRPGGLACRALAENAGRDAKGDLKPEAAAVIRASLAEILDRFPDSPFAVPAIEGLVRTEAGTGRTTSAEEAYAAFRGRNKDKPAVLADARDRLGRLGLMVGGLPEFRGTDLDGADLSSASLVGKVVVVDFWATWCRPCIDGMPTLRRIADRHGDRVAVVGVNLDVSDESTIETLKAWVAGANVPGRHLYDGLGWESELVRAFGVTEIPFTAVIDARGKVVALDEHGKRLEKAVQAAAGSAALRTAAR